MGTEVHCKSYTLGYRSMRDLNENSNSISWPLFYEDKTLSNGHYYNGFMSKTVMDAYQVYDKAALKQKMLEHEAIFKNQLYELHRVYRIQRDMMDEIKRNELQNHRLSFETLSSSILLGSQMPYEDARKWQIPNFPSGNPGCARSSMSGAEIINSPLSSTKGSSPKAGRVASHNVCTSKDHQMLEPRPSKVRKKLFDLQLPADEYIDTEEEQFRGNKASETSSCPAKSHRIASVDCQVDASTSDSGWRNSIRFADLNEPIQVEEAPGPASVDFLAGAALHGENRGTDLSAKPKSQFIGLQKVVLWNPQQRTNNGNMINISVENKGNGREWLSHMSDSGENLAQPTPHKNQRNGKSNLDNVHQGLSQDKFLVPSQPVQLVINKAHQSPGILPIGHREDPWREKAGLGMEFSEKGREQTSYNYPESVVPSHLTNPYPFVDSSDMVNSWSRTLSSWGKLHSSLSQNLTSAQTLPSSNSSITLNRSSQSSLQSNEVFSDKWHVNGNPRSNLHSGSEVPTCNGYYHGSSSGSKDLTHFPSTGFDYLKCHKEDKAAFGTSIDRGSEKCFKVSNFINLKPLKDMNLNVVIPVDSSDEADPQLGCDVVVQKRKCDDHTAVLPWIRAKPSCKTEASCTRRDSNPAVLSFLHASSSQLCNSDTDKIFSKISTQNVASASVYNTIGAKKEMGEHRASRKILGFPIHEIPWASKNDSSSVVSTSAPLSCPSDGIVENGKKIRIIDINLACDAASDFGEDIAAESLAVEEMDTKITRIRNQIDLNSCITEDEEDPLPPLLVSGRADVMSGVEIDLEAPVLLETEEDVLLDEGQKLLETAPQSSQHEVEPLHDDVMRIAAEAIVAISLSVQSNPIKDAVCIQSKTSATDSLLWFVEIVSSFTDDLENNNYDKESMGQRKLIGGEDLSSEAIDDFEVLTLQLIETKEEEYMPKPLVPELPKMDEEGQTSVPNRPRKGPARRGRQRRDFQRDILPGLASLSRHEVTEDLQTFSGMMRATGHPWNSGLTRRNGTRNGVGRGRRRPVVVDTTPSPICTLLMQQLNNMEVGLDDRSLTGWGKTTRRPRRQRCPGGNPPPLPLT